MTEDYSAFDDALDYATPDAITAPGTDLEAGIRTGVASFTSSGAIQYKPSRTTSRRAT